MDNYWSKQNGYDSKNENWQCKSCTVKFKVVKTKEKKIVSKSTLEHEHNEEQQEKKKTLLSQDVRRLIEQYEADHHKPRAILVKLRNARTACKSDK